MMNKIILVGLLLLLLAGCSSKSSVPLSGGEVDLSGSLNKCYVHKDYIACSLSDGKTYFATMESIMKVTTWDKTMWANQT